MIPEYKKILYATDLSVNSVVAFKHAISVARRYDAEVILLHILPDVDQAVKNYVGTVMGEEKLATFELSHKGEVIDEIRQRLHNFAKEELIDHPEDVKRIVDIDIHHGNPVSCILQHADGLNVDLIVLGSHSKGALKYAFLGSVAEKVLRKCHRPILIVPIEAAD